MSEVSTRTPIERRIREKLRERNVSVSKLAENIDVSRVALYHLFKGNYSREMLNKISKELSIPVHILLAPEDSFVDGTPDRLFEAYHAAPLSIRGAVDELLKIGTKAQKRPLVVVIDDIDDNAALLKRCLRKDFDVLEFTDPLDALETIRTKPVDAIVSDQRMPKMTGTQLFMKIDEIGKQMAKLIVSAYSDNEALIEAINTTRIDAFLVKPFRPEELRRRLSTLLGLKVAA